VDAAAGTESEYRVYGVISFAEVYSDRAWSSRVEAYDSFAIDGEAGGEVESVVLYDTPGVYSNEAIEKAAEAAAQASVPGAEELIW
jgi:hypothetical protein